MINEVSILRVGSGADWFWLLFVVWICTFWFDCGCSCSCSCGCGCNIGWDCNCGGGIDGCANCRVPFIWACIKCCCSANWSCICTCNPIWRPSCSPVTWPLFPNEFTGTFAKLLWSSPPSSPISFISQIGSSNRVKSSLISSSLSQSNPFPHKSPCWLVICSYRSVGSSKVALQTMHWNTKPDLGPLDNGWYAGGTIIMLWSLLPLNCGAGDICTSIFHLGWILWEYEQMQPNF